MGVFAGTMALHLLWLGLFPPQSPEQARWASLPPEGPAGWLPAYLETGSYWLGYSYALSLAFAAVALRRFLRDRSRATGGLALGGFTLAGFLSVTGCFLVGCCGSPMLVVWLNLLGARFLPFAKPMVAAITTLLIAGACWGMRRRACCR